MPPHRGPGAAQSSGDAHLCLTVLQPGKEGLVFIRGKTLHSLTTSCFHIM